MLEETAKRVKKDDSQNKEITMQHCCLELYPDSESYKFTQVMSLLTDYIEQKGVQYAYMYHDKDFYVDDKYSNHELIGRKGELKKPHYHIVLHFKHYVNLGDLALYLGIEKRWIKKLKKDSDFDNLLIYCTHIRYPPEIKHHYPVDDYTSNIMDYIRYLYDLELARIQAQGENKNIIYKTIEILESNQNVRFSLKKMINELNKYDINVLNKYYRIIKDLIYEHNMSFDYCIDAKALKSRLLETEELLRKSQHNVEVWALENMRLRGISVDDTDSIFDEEIK